MLKLTAGEYLGKPLHAKQTCGLSLTVTAYPSCRSYPWHVHEQPTLFISLTAQHHDQTQQAAFDQPPISTVFHPATAPHATVTGPDGLVGINLELSNAWFERCHLRPQDLGNQCRLVDSTWARLLAMRVAVLAYGTGEATNVGLEMATLELVSCFVRRAAPPGRTPRWLCQAKEFLATSAHTTVRLRDVAREVGVHPVYFARAFRRATGFTVSAYVHRLRLLSAGHRILDDGQPLSEAALTAGFSDQAHFTRTCSRVLGFTPGQLRRVRQALLTEAPGSRRSRRD